MDKNETRVYLRALEPKDKELLYKWRNDREVFSLTGGNTFFISSLREEKWIEDAIFDDINIRLAICIKSECKYIGNVNLTKVDHLNKTGEISIFIGDKGEWGKGYGSEAFNLMLEYGFSELGLNCIYLTVIDNNQRAIELYKKCGLKEEGTLKERLFKNGKYHDIVSMSILNSDYFSN
jgi:RimJ/RimL family protein N-acetyltransferase